MCFQMAGLSAAQVLKQATLRSEADYTAFIVCRCLPVARQAAAFGAAAAKADAVAAALATATRHTG